MESIGYPDIETQRSEHAGLVRELAVIVRDYKSGKLLVGKQLMTFLRGWLVNHIMQSDKQYGVYAKQKVGS
jgi:hemerythrin